MLTVAALEAYGADVKEGLTRCLSNESFYLRMVGMTLEDENLGRLGKALEEEDWKGAFEAAHALKGVMANLALTPVYAPVSELTEMLRGENVTVDAGEAGRLYAQAEEAFAALKALAE